MDERNRFGQPEDSFDQEPTKREQPSSDSNNSSYYYSYGPFKSLGKDNNTEHPGSEPSDRPHSEEVEITPPNPVRQLPVTSSQYHSSGESGSPGRSGVRVAVAVTMAAATAVTGSLTSVRKPR